MRLGFTIDELALSPPLATVGASTRDGHHVIGIRGRVLQGGLTSTATLYIDASGTNLPVAETGSEGAVHVAVVFSKWNERVIVTAPSGAVTLG